MADSDNNNLPTYRLGALETKVDRLQEDVKALDGRIANLSERVANLSERVTEGLTAMGGRVSALCERITDFEQRTERHFDEQDEWLDKWEDRRRREFRILMRSFLAIGGLILANATGLTAELMSAVSSLFP